MKTIIIVLVTVFTTGFAQAGNSNPEKISVKIISPKPAAQEFGYFRVHRMGRDASLNWSVSDASVIDYFVIERSYDGSYFETIDQVTGTGDATVRYRDVNCFPGYIYYRIQAYQADGTVVSSSVELLRIVAKK